MLRFDFVDLSHATVTREGWITDKPVLTRTGIFEYRRADGTVQLEYRPESEVFHKDHLASLRGVPVTDGHAGLITAENTSPIIGTVLSDGERVDGNVVAEIVIHASKRLGNRRELSLGYSLELEQTPGEFEGKRFDAIQRNLRANHLAVVHRGRAGNARIRLDREDAADAGRTLEDQDTMTEIKLTAVRVDGLEYQASPEVARELDKLRDAAKIATTRGDSLEAERDALKAKVATAETTVAQIRADAEKVVRARVELEATAKQHGVTIRSDMTDQGIREAVATKLSPDTYKFDGKSAEYAQWAYDHAVAEAERAKDKSSAARSAVNGAGGSRTDAAPFRTGGAVAARARMIRNLTHPAK